MENNESQKQDISHPDEAHYGISREHSKELIQALENKDYQQIRHLVEQLHVADIADFLQRISHERRRIFIKAIRKRLDPEILVELNPDLKEEIIELLGPESSAEAITRLDTDDAIDFMEDLDEEDQREILGAMPDEQRRELEEGLSYPEDSAGRLLDKNIVCVPEFWTVGQTIDYLRSENDLPDEFYQIFVVDPKVKPVGGIMLSRIMRSKRPILLKDIMKQDLKLIKADMDQEEVAYIFRQYGLASAPVVNKEGRMIGVITVDDIVNVMEEEAQEDIMRLGGVSETDLHSNFMETVKRRFPWLMANLVTAIIAATVISHFENVIQKIAVIAALMPMVASMGGNAGIQTVTVAVRAIATKELNSTNVVRIIIKELIVGLSNGLIFAIIVSTASYFLYHNIEMSLVFGMSTIVTLLLAGLSGTLIPIGLVKMGVDPAIASSVALTTITDVSAFGIFLGLASFMLI
jgi:magnesium transporter